MNILKYEILFAAIIIFICETETGQNPLEFQTNDHKKHLPEFNQLFTKTTVAQEDSNITLL